MNTYNIYKIIINWPSFSNCVVGRCLTFAWTHHHLEKICPCFSPSMGLFESKFLWKKRHICSSTREAPGPDAWEGIMLLYGWACFKTYYFSDGWNWNSFHPKPMSSTKFEGRIRLILRRQFLSKVHDWNPIFKISLGWDIPFENQRGNGTSTIWRCFRIANGDFSFACWFSGRVNPTKCRWLRSASVFYMLNWWYW